MNEIQLFKDERFGEVRVAGTSEEPLFCLADICRVLDLQVTPTKNRIKPDGVSLIKVIDSLGREQEATFISEQNLYKVIMRSDKPQAEPFQDWVCGEVLPSIRKSGGYIATKEDDTPEMIMARAILVANETITRQKKQIEEAKRQIEQKDEKIAQDAPKVLFADAVSTSKRSCLVAELAIPCKKKGGRKHFVDLTGKRFGKLLVIKEAGIDKWGSVLWECKCDCGNMYIARSGKLVQGRTTNCGCYTSELRSKSATKHGLLKHGIKPRTFIVWNGIKARCLNKNSKSYKNYGARGITICDEWLCYENFHNWALHNGYKDNLTIDRIDNSKGYIPDNCQWIPWKENLMKQRRYILLTVNGETKTLSEWGRFVSVSRWMLTKYFHLKGKKETEKAIADCMQSNKGQIYFLNKFIKTA